MNFCATPDVDTLQCASTTRTPYSTLLLLYFRHSLPQPSPFLNPSVYWVPGFSGPGDAVSTPLLPPPTPGPSFSSPLGSNSTSQHASSRPFFASMPRWPGLGACHCLRRGLRYQKHSGRSLFVYTTCATEVLIAIAV